MTSLCQDNARCIIAMRWLSTDEKHLCRSARTPTKSFHLQRQVRSRRHRIRFPIPICVRLGQNLPLLDPKSHHLRSRYPIRVPCTTRHNVEKYLWHTRAHHTFPTYSRAIRSSQIKTDSRLKQARESTNTPAPKDVHLFCKGARQH